MSSQLVTENVWKTLTSATRQSRQPAAVAVAYFGQSAAKLLPLPARSRLVVDASEAAVKSGQTCPGELKTVSQKNAVRVYSVANLHAKVFVFGGIAFVGSANASWRSADTLIEALLATTDRKAVAAARQFVRDLCLHELGPEELDRLQRMYRPPRYVGTGGAQRHPQNTAGRPGLPRLLLAQLTRLTPPKVRRRPRRPAPRRPREVWTSRGSTCSRVSFGEAGALSVAGMWWCRS